MFPVTRPAIIEISSSARRSRRRTSNRSHRRGGSNGAPRGRSCADGSRSASPPWRLAHLIHGMSGLRQRVSRKLLTMFADWVSKPSIPPIAPSYTRHFRRYRRAVPISSRGPQESHRRLRRRTPHLRRRSACKLNLSTLDRKGRASWSSGLAFSPAPGRCPRLRCRAHRRPMAARGDDAVPRLPLPARDRCGGLSGRPSTSAVPPPASCRHSDSPMTLKDCRATCPSQSSIPALAASSAAATRPDWTLNPGLVPKLFDTTLTASRKRPRPCYGNGGHGRSACCSDTKPTSPASAPM